MAVSRAPLSLRELGSDQYGLLLQDLTTDLQQTFEQVRLYPHDAAKEHTTSAQDRRLPDWNRPIYWAYLHHSVAYPVHWYMDVDKPSLRLDRQ